MFKLFSHFIYLTSFNFVSFIFFSLYLFVMRSQNIFYHKELFSKPLVQPNYDDVSIFSFNPDYRERSINAQDPDHDENQRYH